MKSATFFTAITLAALLSGVANASGWTLEKSFEGFIHGPLLLEEGGLRPSPISRTVYVPVEADDSVLHTSFRLQNDGYGDEDWKRPAPPKGVPVDLRWIPKDILNEGSVIQPPEIITPTPTNPHPVPNPANSGSETPVDPVAEKLAALTSLVEKLVPDEGKGAANLAAIDPTNQGREKAPARDYPAGTTETFIVLFVMAGGAFIFALLTAMEFRRRWIMSISTQNSRLGGSFDWSDDDFLPGSYLPEPRLPLDYRF